MLVGVIVLAVVFGVGLIASAGGETAKTCKDLGYADNLTASSLDDWGSVAFDDTEDTLTLTVVEGYEATLCVKAGSANQGLGPEEVGPFSEGTHYVGHSSGKELSHYGIMFIEISDDTTTTTLVDGTTTTTSASTSTTVTDDTTTTQADEGTTTTLGETTTTAQVTTTQPTTTTTPGVDPDTAEELPFTGMPAYVWAGLGLALVGSGAYVLRFAQSDRG
jgi:hypothetical protein